MRTQEKGNLPSQPETDTLNKIEGINTISTLHDDIPEITIAISLRSAKCLMNLFQRIAIVKRNKMMIIATKY